eukprot:m.171460 g.171460  ORF g.171460 m.171460 type:complete len:79 (-) comp16501_c0_seq1:329-565(-)
MISVCSLRFSLLILLLPPSLCRSIDLSGCFPLHYSAASYPLAAPKASGPLSSPLAPSLLLGPLSSAVAAPLLCFRDST